jgi:hypothetical protein
MSGCQRPWIACCAHIRTEIERLVDWRFSLRVSNSPMLRLDRLPRCQLAALTDDRQRRGCRIGEHHLTPKPVAALSSRLGCSTTLLLNQ